MNGTPIFDIKPYIPYCDCHPDATGGFTENAHDYILKIDFPSALMDKIPDDKRQALLEVLSHDPRPSYQSDPDRVYGISFAGYDVRFRVEDKKLTVIDVV